MQDAYFGHRDWFTGEPNGDRDEKTDWDYALTAAYQIIQDNTSQDGVLRWEEEADNIAVDADRKFSKFRASQESRTSGKNYKPLKGEYFVPNVKLLYGEYPTYREYLERLIAEDSEEE